MYRDWFDDYLDALSDPGASLYFPPDAPANQKGAKQRLMFDAVASSEEEKRLLYEARLALEHHGDSAYERTTTTPADAGGHIITISGNHIVTASGLRLRIL